MCDGGGSVDRLCAAPEQEGGVQERFREGTRIPSRGLEGPKQRTHPSWFEAGTAFLTLCPQKTGEAMANASGIQDPKRAIARRLVAPGDTTDGQQGNAASHPVAG